MRTISAGSRATGWMRSFRPAEVALTSPYSPDECCHRLAEVTSARGFSSWHLDLRNTGRHEPVLRGDVSPSRFLVADFESASSRNSFAPWLDLRPEPDAGGGTVLTGTIGLADGSRLLLPLLALIGLVITVGALAGTIGEVASGHLAGLGFLVIPVLTIGFLAGVLALGRWSLRREIPILLRDLEKILATTRVSQETAAKPQP
jgi:hypothetical protein